MRVALLPNSAPVPCVAVAVAPAIDWRSMSPRFGSANPRPRFGWFGVRLTHVELVGEGGHLRCRLTDTAGASAKAMAFRAMATDLGERLLGARDRNVHIAGTLRRDGRRHVSDGLLPGDLDMARVSRESLARPRSSSTISSSNSSIATSSDVGT